MPPFSLFRRRTHSGFPRRSLLKASHLSIAGRYTSPLVPQMRVSSAGAFARWRRKKLPAAADMDSVARLATNGPAESDRSARSARQSRLEALFLLARQPLAVRKLARMANLADGTEARTLIRALQQLYDQRGCAFQIVQVAGGYQLLTRAKFAPWLQKFTPPDDFRLSPPAMETLAVVAYRQPAVRAEIEAIRGVQCGELLRQLMDRDLLRIVGRSEELGRPILYGTTPRFLQVFGLQSIDQLPQYTALRNEPWEADQTDSPPPTETAAERIAS